MKLHTAKPPKKMTGVRSSVFSVKLGVNFWLIIGVIILCLSGWWNSRTDREVPTNKDTDYVYAAPQPGRYLEGVKLPFSIPVQVPEHAKYIIVTFKYRVSPSFKSAWLMVPTQQVGGGSKILVDHELFRRHLLQSFYSKGTSLYQKIVSYRTIDDFLKSSHHDGVVVADSNLISWYSMRFPELSKLIPLESYVSSTIPPDYVWTTFTKPRIFPEGWNVFSRSMSVAQPIRDKDGITMLQLVSDNPNETLDITEPEIRFK